MNMFCIEMHNFCINVIPAPCLLVTCTLGFFSICPLYCYQYYVWNQSLSFYALTILVCVVIIIVTNDDVRHVETLNFYSFLDHSPLLLEHFHANLLHFYFIFATIKMMSLLPKQRTIQTPLNGWPLSKELQNKSNMFKK